MRGILADNNAERHLAVLLLIWEGHAWREMWVALQLAVYAFPDLGLWPSVSDAILWHTCQQQVVLVTGNRNQDGPDSLEATIRVHNTVRCLPVFTLANMERILDSGAYAATVAERLLQHLYDMENLRGTGRMYLP